MPIVFQYLLKLSISLAIMYLFYQIVLRRLTFYNHNRWYLSGYSLLCFLISFINIGPILQQHSGQGYEFINFIPSVGDLAKGAYNGSTELSGGTAGWSTWNWIMLFIVLGIVVLVTRLVLQVISFKRMQESATLITGPGIRFYQVNRPIIPFSFGNSIYINQDLHTETELKEIIRHEFVHVKQRHTLDIIWAELLCIVNWYNPFAWLIKKAIRQNLEFIADNKVIANGIDKKQYQYLLLKVIGNNHFSIASPFNFSSLKKRIVMMNKIKSARVHLFRFLFILPLLAVLLLAFRDQLNKHESVSDFWLAGLTLNNESGAPLAGVVIEEESTGVKTVSDNNGYFKLHITHDDAMPKMLARYTLPGFQVRNERLSVSLDKVNGKKRSEIHFVYMQNDSKKPTVKRWNHSAFFSGEPDFVTVSMAFDKFSQMVKRDDALNDLAKSSSKPIWVADGMPYAISGNGSKAWLDKQDMQNSPGFKVFVDGKIMTMEEVNATIERSQVKGVGAIARASAEEHYGVSDNLLLLELTHKVLVHSSVDTVPNENWHVGKALERSYTIHRDDHMGDRHKLFFTRNSKINLLHWKKNGSIDVYLEGGKVNHYSTPADFKKFESEFGPVPVPGGSVVKAASPAAPASPASPATSVSPAAPVPAVTAKPRTRLTGSPGDDNVSKFDYKLELESGASKPIVIVDGEQWPAGINLNIIDAKRIESVNIYKGESAVNLYGDKAKDGVIVVATKKQPGKAAGVKVMSNPVYYINGKKISKEAVDLIDPSFIQSIDVLKGKEATNKYGNDGKNGVIEITTPVTRSSINGHDRPALPGWDFRNKIMSSKKDEC